MNVPEDRFQSFCSFSWKGGAGAKCKAVRISERADGVCQRVTERDVCRVSSTWYHGV